MISQKVFTSKSGVKIYKKEEVFDNVSCIEDKLPLLTTNRGAYLCSGYEYPGRYSRWDILVIDPPVELSSFKNKFTLKTLNKRGVVINRFIFDVLKDNKDIESVDIINGNVVGRTKLSDNFYTEEQRSKKPSIFSIIRALMNEFGSDDIDLGFVGMFGYDLIFQFEEIDMKFNRPDDLHDLRLFFYDEKYLVDRKKEVTTHILYDFSYDLISTVNISRDSLKPELSESKLKTQTTDDFCSDHINGEYQSKVEYARSRMHAGDYFELVLQQKFTKEFNGNPLELFRKLQLINPSPYEFFFQFGDEQIIGASPEMFIRVTEKQVESCPISGTIKRGKNALEDAALIKDLINSQKDESELTMCTDVDRNDKSRVCKSGSVKLIGRRLIEKYAGLFHTVDHVVGELKDGYDSIDAFLSHMWAVTLTGAPKKAAIQEIENLEKEYRGWYGGAVGILKLNGDINTGITIRTIHLKNGIASYKVGATLHYDSDPQLEQEEVLTKSTSFFKILSDSIEENELNESAKNNSHEINKKRVLFIDNEDSFVHTLGSYVEEAGGEVTTVRWNFPYEMIDEIKPDLIFISPGPGRPSDFKVSNLVNEAIERNIPLFGVCLGLQGIVEAFGGSLDVLEYPTHGKLGFIEHNSEGIFTGLTSPLEVGRYHSLIASKAGFPAELEITAETSDGIIMGVRSKKGRVEAVQFHPESILSSKNDDGLKLIKNLLRSI